jgi:indolepyruvate ferredoxin oxidoreductase beta subunit
MSGKKCDILLAGVGGQGVLSISSVIANAALADGLEVKQAEVHGMSQRGGAVESHLRISAETIWSDLVPRGTADLILSMEPLESLRYLEWLREGGIVVTSIDPVRNIGNYPDLPEILAKIARIPGSITVEAERLAREAGSARATNMVIVGAAASRLPVSPDAVESAIRRLFGRKGEKVVDINLAAFRAGQKVGASCPAR